LRPARHTAAARDAPFSAHKVQSILVATDVSQTSDALQRAAKRNLDVVFLDRLGDAYGRFWQNFLGSMAANRRQATAPKGWAWSAAGSGPS
jgi:CRISPR/Cas system-associated endonuclease Cas1